MPVTKCEPRRGKQTQKRKRRQMATQTLARNHREGGGTSECTRRRIMALRCSSWRIPRMILTRCPTPVGPNIYRWSQEEEG